VGLVRTWPEAKVAVGNELLRVLDAVPMADD
jgi:hypothetical protein